MSFYLQMSKNITEQRDIYETVIFRFLQIFYTFRFIISPYIYICKISMFELDYVRTMQTVGYMNCWTLYIVVCLS